MDNLEKLIEDLSSILQKKFIDQFYLISSNLNTKVSSSEVLNNWSCFLSRNNIELILVYHQDVPVICKASAEDILINLINREQHRIKNKFIFLLEYWSPYSHAPIGRFYHLTTRENAQKLVVLESFEN